VLAYEIQVLIASRDDGFPPVPPWARHPGSDRPLGTLGKWRGDRLTNNSDGYLSVRPQYAGAATNLDAWFMRNSSGSFATLAAIRRASSLLSTWPPNAAPARPRNKHRQVVVRCGRAQQSRPPFPRFEEAFSRHPLARPISEGQFRATPARLRRCAGDT
jgi:hypothetical protein